MACTTYSRVRRSPHGHDPIGSVKQFYAAEPDDSVLLNFNPELLIDAQQRLPMPVRCLAPTFFNIHPRYHAKRYDWNWCMWAALAPITPTLQGWPDWYQQPLPPLPPHRTLVAPSDLDETLHDGPRPLGHQRSEVRCLLARRGDVLADEMGLNKR